MPSQPERVRVLMATDSFLLGDGLAAIIGREPGIDVVGRARDLVGLLRMVSDLDPDVVIYGIRTSVITSTSTVSMARHFRTDHPQLGFVVIDDTANGFALEMLRTGASRLAYLLDSALPSADAVIAAIWAVHLGESVVHPSIVDASATSTGGDPIGTLTAREAEVLRLMAHGCSNKATAAELGVSLKSVEKCVTAIFLKLGPVDHHRVDRRVFATLVYLQARAHPFVRVDATATARPGGPDRPGSGVQDEVA